ncbi:MAG: hypothetical protein QOJ08_1331 [Ilumatobacteraceae bacterium]|jgi:uncharacterized protein with FMN-binding domain
MTTAASGLVALLDQPSGGSAVDAGGASGAVLPDQGGGTVVVQPPVVSSTLPAVEQPTPSVVTPVLPTSPTPTPAPTTTVPAAAAGTCEGQTIDGPTVDTRWGPVQVEAVVSSSGQVCDVDAIQSPNDHRRSVQINQNALPILHTQVMKAQSTDINGVSGATVTTRGYERSLQSILDSVGA